MVRWNDTKAEWLWKERRINIEEVAAIIENELYLDIDRVPAQDKHPGQLMFLILLNDYVYCVPYVVEEDGTIFIKTVFPSRKYNSLYKRGD